MRVLFKIFVTGLLSILFYSKACFAELNLTLTQGSGSTLPIAVVPFASDDHQLNTIIGNDLKNSGKFTVLEGGSLPAQPHDASQVNLEQWKAIKQNNVLVGTVSQEGFNQYRLHFQLLDVCKGGSPILDQTIVVPKAQYRLAAHHVSDSVFQALTGIRGIFSTRIAYVLVSGAGRNARYALEVADYDGFNPKPILTSNEPILSPAWSHDGKKIAYVSYEGGHSQIYISTVATGARQLLTAYPGVNSAPAWSPNDAEVALVLSKEGNTNIFIKTLGGGLNQLTSGSSLDTEPSFSPNGQSLLFTSDRGGSPQIYRETLSGHQINRMTFNGNYNARGSFSPDGNEIVMIHAGSDSSGYGIGLQDLQSGAYLILDNSGDDQSPSFSPNGQMVIFASKTSGVRQLGLVSIDGHIKLRLPSDQGNVQEPVWSPFLN